MTDKFKFANGEYFVHGEQTCQTSGIRACVIHNPSDHHMKDWPMILRESALVERQCPHGTGHPDPDSLAFFTMVDDDSSYMGVHGCDGCCQKSEAKIKPSPDTILKVDWIDSGMFFEEGWANTEVYQRSAGKWTGMVTTVGAIIFEDDKVLVLGLSHDTENDNYFGAQLIYKPCIIDRKEVK